MQKKKRTALEATVDAVGRDQQDQILYLKKDAYTQIWDLEKVENELHQGAARSDILDSGCQAGVRRETEYGQAQPVCACRCRFLLAWRQMH